MRFIVSVIFAVSIMCGQIVAASPREDAEFVTQSIMAAFGNTTLLESLAHTYAGFLTDELDAQSVHVIDADRFEKLLPVEVLEPWLLRWQEIFTAQLLDRYTPEDLARMANGARTVDDEPEGENPFATDAAFYVFSSFGGFHLWSQMQMIKELKSSVPPLTDTPFMADILETDGVFSFPNPIWRRDLIARIRRTP